MELAAFRAARLAMVSGEADRLLADTDASVASLLADARREAEAILAQARADGIAEAERQMATAQALGQRSARRIVLAARSEAYQSLCEQARVAALGLRGTSDYPRLLDRLERLARERLGEDAVIERDPPDGGGVIAEARGRRVDYSLASLVERALREPGEEVERLWT